MAEAAAPPPKDDVKLLDRVTIRFAGDSGDGIQLMGAQFTLGTAASGNDLATLPDYPAEIRAPAGTLPGVSSYQISFSSHAIHTPGDRPDVLVAMNPAALKVHLKDLVSGGIIVANSDSFVRTNLQKAGFEENPLENGELSDFRVVSLPITTTTIAAVAETGLTKKEAERCKNFFALGAVFWLYSRPLEPTCEWIESKFGVSENLVKANELALKAGFNYALTTEVFTSHYAVRQAKLAPGTYRNVSGTDAMCFGLIAASQKMNKPLFYGSYPITPASDILHGLARYKNFNVRTFQAEDEIAAMGATIGAAYGGHLSVTGTSGPGLALKAEALGLAVMLELPMVIIDVQRGGPSTGLPTKTEQSDLNIALYGRHGECPVPVLAAKSPADCFDIAFEAARLAVKHMTPVLVLSDGYLTNGSEPWRLPDLDTLPAIPVSHEPLEPDHFMPYAREKDTLARAWVLPGAKGREHRIGGLEKNFLTGNVDYVPSNHERMVNIRAEKVEKLADDIPPLEVFGEDKGELLVLGWGSSYGAITSAVEELRDEGIKVSSAHLRHINPLPTNLGDILGRFRRVLVPEMNRGQLRVYLQSIYMLPLIGQNKIQGQPFRIDEIKEQIRSMVS